MPLGGDPMMGRHPADRGRVRDAQQQAGGEVALRNAILGNPPGFLEAGAGTAAQYQVDDAQGDRHHHGRAGGIRHPHAQEGGDRHEAADDGARTGPDQAQGEERDAPVEAPALDGNRDDEAAHEEEDHVRGVGRQDAAQGRDAQQREGHDRQESGRLDIDRLGEPPSRHPDHQGERGAPRLRELDPLAGDGRILRGKQVVAEQPEQRPAEQADASDHRCRHSKDPGPGPATCSSLYR
jgi:hypothetical protein